MLPATGRRASTSITSRPHSTGAACARVLSSSGSSGATGIRAAASSTCASASGSGYDHQQRKATLRSHFSARSVSPSTRIRSAISISAVVRAVPDHSCVANSSRSHAMRVRSPALSGERLGVAQEANDDVAAAELERQLGGAQQPRPATGGDV